MSVFVKKPSKIIGSSIVLMMEQYKKNNQFALESILFTLEEIAEKANKLFPSDDKKVSVDDVKSCILGRGSASKNKFLTKGSDDSLAEYCRLCGAEEGAAFELQELLEKLDISDVHMPNGFKSAEQFVNAYFEYIKTIEMPVQEQRASIQSRVGVWIAAATLTYNEYVRTNTTNITQYAFRQKSIAKLVQIYNPNNTRDACTQATKALCTKGKNDQNYSYLIPIANKRRIAFSGEDVLTIPEDLPLDFTVNTIRGRLTVGALVSFIDNEYTTLAKKYSQAALEQYGVLFEEDIEKDYDEQSFLDEVFMDSQNYNRLIQLIRRKKNIILQGAPGVGKTYIAKKLAFSYMGECAEARVLSMQFHQNYSYEDFVEGYRPKDNGYEMKKGIFFEFCKTAEKDMENDYFFIIDEMNRGNLSKIFGELFTMLEKGKRGEEIKLVYSGEAFSVPENVYIIGLMNTADRSLAMIDYALRRRFGFFTMKPAFDTNGFKEYKAKFASRQFDELIEQIKKLNEDIAKDDSLGEGFCIGHSFFCELAENNVLAQLESIVENEIIPLLEEYWFDERENVRAWSEKLRSALG